jgi:drug/metabolite transporter (DMT)-like permease
MPDASANYRGILAMIGAGASFSANDACTKLAVKWIPATEIVAIRGVFTFIFALLIIAARGELTQIRYITNWVLTLRALAEAGAGLLLVTALAFMPIANVTAILLIQPFLMAIAAVLLFKQMVGPRRWAAIAVGFLGMLLVVKPATEAFDAISLLALAAAFLALTRDLLTRRLRAEVPTTVVTLATALVGLVVGVLGAAAEKWVVPDFRTLAIVALSAAFIVLAYIFIVIAFRGTDVSLVAPFRYAIVIFAVIFGIILFAEIPDLISFAGIGLIVGAGLYLLHREAMQRRPKGASPP